ncbi:uncharacterized protein LOC116257369 isoform X1 [Nymphaea colorata]|nr:uncharacterized protein LOC116257369 isoform X1 [Nymphaea colorata]
MSTMRFPATSERERRRNLSPEPSAVADLRLCGRHALLFDDDASAAFINSVDALLPWSAHPSLLLDRYDVRHLLTDLPPRRKSGSASLPPLESGVSESDLERERYQDLPECDEGGDDGVAECRESSKSGAYGAVAFSYGNGLDASNAPGMSETVGYHPPFSVPENLLHSLPPSEKLHQIMSRTALFVNKHGGQSEIILRVKQGDNPTFGFLMPDHNLHPYFRFLVDHPELLLADTGSANLQEPAQKADAVEDNTVSAGALSLLGSMYGNEEEEDRSQKVASDTKSLLSPEVAAAASVSCSDSPDAQEHSAEITKKNEVATSMISDKKKFLSPEKKSTPVEVQTSDVHGKKRVPEVPKTAFASTSNHQALASSILEDNLPILEPPNFLKSAVEKVVEFIVRNGKQFEAVLIEQDKPHGRFPFLLKSNPFHRYYLKVLQEVQESKTSGKSSKTRKHDPEGHSSGSKRIKEVSKSKDSDDSQNGRSIGRESAIAGQSIVASDLDKKEKFKMVIGGPSSKKDTSDQSSKPVQRHCGMSVDAAAEIVLAATRGLRNQKSNVSMSCSSILENGAQTATNVMHQTKSIGSHSISSHGHDSHTKPNSDMESGKIPSGYASGMKAIGSGNVLAAKAMAKTAALAAADEADSSEACLTKAEKQKAERLRRAKMFSAMLKSDSHQSTGSIPRLSPPLSNSGLSSGKLAPLGNLPQVAAQPTTSVAEPVDAMYRELDGSIVLVDGDPSTMKLELQGKDSAGQSEERSTEKQHLGSKRHDKDPSGHKHSRSKHRRKESSRYDEEDDSEESEEDSYGKRSRYRSQEKDRSISGKHDHEDLDEHKHSRKRHRHSGSSQHAEEDNDGGHSSHKDRETESRHKSKHHRHSERRHRHRHESRAESTSRPEKHRTKSHSEREVDDNAICITTVDNDGTTLSLNHPNNLEAQDNSHTVTEVSDELRQKVRAMLLANM